MSATRIPGDRLRQQVLAAATGNAESIAALLREVTPTLYEIVAAELLEFEGLAPVVRLVRMRDDIVEALADRLSHPTFLGEWGACPADRTWRFIEDWAAGVAGRLRDQWWVRRALVDRDAAARERLLRRLLGLFERAARRRGLGVHDREEARQSFSLWLFEDDARALRRWSPDGGRTFDAWFYARALNQIDTWRRGSASTTTEEDPSESSDDSSAAGIAARRNLAKIDAWLQANCDERKLEIFYRRFIDNESPADIAESLAMRRENVYVTIQRLRKSIRELFDP